MSTTGSQVRETPVARLPEALELTSLLKRMAGGDQEAAAALYDATSSAVFSLASIVCPNSGAAEALTCQVYVDAWTSAPAFAASKATATSWLAALVGKHLQRTA